MNLDTEAKARSDYQDQSLTARIRGLDMVSPLIGLVYNRTDLKVEGYVRNPTRRLG